MNLPTRYLVTPSPAGDNDFLKSLEKSLQCGIKLMQLRSKGMQEADYIPLAREAVNLAHRYECKILLGAAPELVELTGADGVQIDSKNLNNYSQRPLSKDFLVAASGHTLEALVKAQTIDADFGLLSPVKFTKSHADLTPFGWDGLQTVVNQLSMPVYAFGGVSVDDEETAIKTGALGIACTRGLWRAD